MAISAKQYEQMVGRMTGGGKKAADTKAAGAAPQHKVIIGIDPSLRGTGFGLIQWDQGRSIILDQGTIVCKKDWKNSRCLARIHDVLREAILKYQPTACAIEGLFYAQNYRTALVMGEARGAALVAAGSLGLEIYEMAPRKVKQAIVGYGNAQKIAVAKMVQRMLSLNEVPDADAADALALALAFAQEQGRRFGVLPKQI